MPQYVVTYLQEVTHVIEQPDTHAAGAKAKQYARDHRLQVLAVVRKDIADKLTNGRTA